jgi:serine/threonine protein kinase
MELKNYEVIEEIGEGSYSTVYKVKCIQTNILYAMKKIKYMSLSDKQKEYAKEEISILKKIKHPNIIKLEKSFSDDDGNLYIIMELACEGDLQQKINKMIEKSEQFSVDRILNYVYQIVLGLQILHDNNIIHRDIKPSNIFIINENLVKIGDFNVAKFSLDGFARTKIGTPYNMSPQVLNGLQYDCKADIWSLGSVAYEMATLTKPYDVEHPAALMNKINNKRLVIKISKELNTLVKKLMKLRPEKRPNCSNILSMDMFKNFKKDDSSKLIYLKRKTEKSNTANYPSMIDLTADKDSPYKKFLGNSPSYGRFNGSSQLKGCNTPKITILRSIYRQPSVLDTSKKIFSSNVSPHQKAHHKKTISREMSFRRLDSTENMCEITGVSSQKVIFIPKLKTPSAVEDLLHKYPISFSRKKNSLGKSLSRIANIDKSTTKNIPKDSLIKGDLSNDNFLKKFAMYKKKSFRNMPFVSKVGTPKPNIKSSHISKSFLQPMSK